MIILKVEVLRESLIKIFLREVMAVIELMKTWMQVCLVVKVLLLVG